MAPLLGTEVPDLTGFAGARACPVLGIVARIEERSAAGASRRNAALGSRIRGQALGVGRDRRRQAAMTSEAIAEAVEYLRTVQR